MSIFKRWFGPKAKRFPVVAKGSILSERPDGAGYHYGFIPGDHRQINVCRHKDDGCWRAYVGGRIVGDPEYAYRWQTKLEAEAAAIEYANNTLLKGREK